MYNKISLEFLFLTLKTMGMAQKFVGNGENVNPRCKNIYLPQRRHHKCF
jgi:hypothetical protein